MKVNAQSVKSVKSAERVLDLLEFIGEHPDGKTFTELSLELGIPKSSLHALLDVLASRSYVELEPHSKNYTLGLRLWETGQAFEEHHNVIREAPAVLDWMVEQVNETAQLAKLIRFENIYLAKVDSTHPLRLQSEVGVRLSAHATGVGKALLAQLPDADVIARFGDGDLQSYTKNTLSSVAALLDELQLVRERGFAIDNEEYTPGVFCIAVPVFDNGGKASSAVSISLPFMRAERSGLATILSTVAAGSLRISERCGVRKKNAPLSELEKVGASHAAIETIISSGRYDLPWID